MHLKPRSTRLIFAAVACIIFMAAPFVITITSIRAGSTNCGSWTYPVQNSGSECYNALTSAFRIAFFVGVVGLAVPIIYLIEGRQHGHENGLIRGSNCMRQCCDEGIHPCQVPSAKRGERRPWVWYSGGGNRRRKVSPAALSGRSSPSGQHPAVLIGPIVLALDGLLAAGVLTATILHGNGPLVTVVWIAWLALFARMIWKGVNWADTFFVVTSRRMLLVEVRSGRSRCCRSSR